MKNSIRWRCTSCKKATFNSVEDVPQINEPLVHDVLKCVQMFPIEIQCLLSYENLKEEAIEKDFKFDERYKFHMQTLQSKFNLEDVSIHFVTKDKARNCINSIRRAVKKDQPAVNTIDLLEIPDDLGFIIVKGEKQLFKRYDNHKNENRKVIFFSDTAMQILAESCFYFYRIFIKFFYLINLMIGFGDYPIAQLINYYWLNRYFYKYSTKTHMSACVFEPISLQKHTSTKTQKPYRT